ncbi:MAG TPA: alpha/beta hydrolase [Ktedonobacterales bacterium]|jgi:pimeloyl-ACP methyl ester carboxylesterase|nr:alpha/beta hydrolase [Ktedonobacterales bacterium]
MSEETPETPEAAKTETPHLAERAVQVAGLRIATAMNDVPRFLLGRVPLVVLPAANHPWQDYRLILERFASERRVFALDWPGFGSSDKPTPADFAYSIKSYAEILAGWMDSLGVARAVFVGNSVGAGAAIQYAAARPQRALGLLLVAPTGFTPPGITRWTAARFLGTPSALRAVVGGFTSLYLGPTTDATKGVMDRQKELRASLDYNASIDACAALWRSFDTPAADLSAVAREVIAPAMVARGALDPIITETDARRAAETLGANTGKRALEVVLPNAGHLPFLQEPERFLKAVEGLLATAEVNAATAN